MKKMINTLLWIIGIAMILSYLFWPADIVPEAAMPILGFLDDAIISLIILLIINRIDKKFDLTKSKKKR